jgi:hypothetical protein
MLVLTSRSASAPHGPGLAFVARRQPAAGTLDARCRVPSSLDTSRHHITTTTTHHPPTALQFHSRRPVQCAYRRRPVSCDPPIIYRRRPLSQPPPAHRRARRVVLLSQHSFQGRQSAACTPTHAHINARSSLSHRLRARTQRPDRHRIISPPPVATRRSRQAAPFLHSTSYSQPDTQASPQALSIEQAAINHTAADTSVHLVAPH